MLNPEQAGKELAKFKRQNWIEVRLPGIGRLPERLRPTARTMLGIDEQGAKLEYLRRSKERLKLFEFVPRLGAAERVQLFESLFPGLGRTVEAGWKLHDRFPYQTGYTRKPFRASGQGAALSERRVVWLTSLLEAIGPYSQPLPWLAAWAAHFSGYEQADAVGILLAASIDQGDPGSEQVFETLCASARGEHEIGGMGRHVTRGLLCASRPGGWEMIEKLLLAAQREEGLRQVILETVDEAHPEAFRRMLHLIKEHDLARFSATVRAVNTWFGFGWDAVSTGIVNSELERALEFLQDPAARNLGVFAADAETAYLALWATAFDDAIAALEPADELLKHREPAHRFVAVHFLDQIGLAAAQEKLLPAIGDADVRVAVRAMLAIQGGAARQFQTAELFDALERLHARLPAGETKFEPLVWPWCGYTLDRRIVHGALVSNSRNVPPTRLLAYLGGMDAAGRHEVARGLSGTAWRDPDARKALLALAGDSSADVREMALRGLERRGLEAGEAPELEKLLTRSGSGVRRGVLLLLLKQEDIPALASADRLLASASAEQRVAGLELLRQMVEATRATDECRSRAAAYREGHPARNEFEEAQLAGIGACATEKPTLENGLGLLIGRPLSESISPRPLPIILHSPATVLLLRSLDDLIWENRDMVVRLRQSDGAELTGLLGDRPPIGHPDYAMTAEEDRKRFFLTEFLESWWNARPAEMRDSDGNEVLRVMFFLERNLATQYEPRYKPCDERWRALWRMAYGIDDPIRIRSQGTICDLFRWVLRLDPPVDATGYMLDALESSLALPEPFPGWLELARSHQNRFPARWTDEHHARLWRLIRWLSDQPMPNGYFLRPRLSDVLHGHRVGAAADGDLILLLVGEREVQTGGCLSAFYELGTATQQLRRSRQPVHLSSASVIRQVADRIVSVELARGEAPTVSLYAALQVFHHAGVGRLVSVLVALGKEKFARTYDRDDPSRASVFSHLVYRCRPAGTDTLEDFAAKAMAVRIPEKRLVELAVYAPHWARFVEHALGWPGLTEAVRWIHTHTRTGEWTWRDESKEFWHAGLSEHTALTADDLVDGAVDVAWFQRMHGALGGDRWAKAYDAAKYACTGAGHTRARLFADALLGAVNRTELVKRITDKRHQDSARALGLLPLPKSGREAEVLARYQILHEFMRGSKEFGAQRRASEKRAAEIGLENLARTAGYADPLRLQWAMEARAIEDLAEGPVNVTAEGVTVSLGIDPWGEVELTAIKDGKRLADVPARLKKQPDIARLRERKVELKRQASRIRPSLEQLMVRGDTFTGVELRELMKHPFLRPMLSNLVLVGDGVMGYPAHEGQALEDCAGGVEGLKADEKLRIAHPFDLLPAARWHEWQKDCFAKERIQPFKQVFRELYPLTETEKQEGTKSRRYAGHQVQPRQTLALLGQRGWVHHPEEGVRKTFHDAGLTVWLEFQETFHTPAEIEGLTLESVTFVKRGEDSSAGIIKLADVPSRLFSEAMRDLDLVVSVAHRGGVDPEASASTVEMRAALVEETSRLLKLGNVRVKDRYALVKGELSEYTVHLGSAVTRKMPGETLFIVPVQSQHRGRLFLPFADDDPRTAEVMSKVLLLARDKEIKDPNILDQIRQR